MAKKYVVGWTFGGPEKRQYKDTFYTASQTRANQKYEELRRKPDVGTIGIREWTGGAGTLVRDNFEERRRELDTLQAARRRSNLSLVPEPEW